MPPCCTARLATTQYSDQNSENKGNGRRSPSPVPAGSGLLPVCWPGCLLQPCQHMTVHPATRTLLCSSAHTRARPASPSDAPRPPLCAARQRSLSPRSARPVPAVTPWPRSSQASPFSRPCMRAARTRGPAWRLWAPRRSYLRHRLWSCTTAAPSTHRTTCRCALGNSHHASCCRGGVDGRGRPLPQGIAQGQFF